MDLPKNVTPNDLIDIGRPTSSPLVPMLWLDSSFNILDWNDAFSLAFDRSADGKRGKCIAEWYNCLNNSEQLIVETKRWLAGKRRPQTRLELVVRFKSECYGAIHGITCLYPIGGRETSGDNWLVIFSNHFIEKAASEAFHRDLVRVLREDALWSEYSVYYDNVLPNTLIYPDLLERMVGSSGGLPEIASKSIVLDLGAGTGNLSLLLAKNSQKQLLIYALDKNDAMIAVLRQKCSDHIRSDMDGPGIVVARQDMRSLDGLPKQYFDHVMLNNVLFTLRDPVGLLKQVFEILKPGGDVRISGPKKDARLDILFDQIRQDLISNDKLPELEEDLKFMEQVNFKYLSPMLHRWNVSDLELLLIESGLSEIVYATDDVYAGQSMIVAARRPKWAK